MCPSSRLSWPCATGSGAAPSSTAFICTEIACTSIGSEPSTWPDRCSSCSSRRTREGAGISTCPDRPFANRPLWNDVTAPPHVSKDPLQYLVVDAGVKCHDIGQPDYPVSPFPDFGAHAGAISARTDADGPANLTAPRH